MLFSCSERDKNGFLTRLLSLNILSNSLDHLWYVQTPEKKKKRKRKKKEKKKEEEEEEEEEKDLISETTPKSEPQIQPKHKCSKGNLRTGE